MMRTKLDFYVFIVHTCTQYHVMIFILIFAQNRVHVLIKRQQPTILLLQQQREQENTRASLE
jgi:hypothetical protein